jgi:hypothetical protein
MYIYIYTSTSGIIYAMNMQQSSFLLCNGPHKKIAIGVYDSVSGEPGQSSRYSARTTWVSIVAAAPDVSLLRNLQTNSITYSASCSAGTVVPLPGLEQPEILQLGSYSCSSFKTPHAVVS